MGVTVGIIFSVGNGNVDGDTDEVTWSPPTNSGGCDEGDGDSGLNEGCAEGDCNSRDKGICDMVIQMTQLQNQYNTSCTLINLDIK